jgi:hypothetical protein
MESQLPFHGDSVDPMYDASKARGVTIAVPPRDPGTTARIMVIVDPHAHAIELAPRGSPNGSHAIASWATSSASRSNSTAAGAFAKWVLESFARGKAIDVDGSEDLA